MGRGLLELVLATPPVEQQRAVGQASAVVLLVVLIGLVVLCVAVLVLARRRSRADEDQRGDRDADRPSDAWVESAKRMALEDDDEIPREPGTA